MFNIFDGLQFKTVATLIEAKQKKVTAELKPPGAQTREQTVKGSFKSRHDGVYYLSVNLKIRLIHLPVFPSGHHHFINNHIQ